MVALTCTIGTDVPIGTVKLATVLGLCTHTSHLLMSRLMCCSEACTYVCCSCVVAGHAYVMHILCARVLHDAHCHYCYLGVRVLKHIYASAYVSMASTHTSKLPLWASVVLNTMMHRSQLQVTSRDQSNGSNDMSALRIKLINSEWVTCNMITWCNGMHIKCTTQGCQFDPGHW